MDRTLRCAVCARVIGLHEPMVVLFEGEATPTTAAEAQAGNDGDRMHRGCYQDAYGQRGPRDDMDDVVR